LRGERKTKEEEEKRGSPSTKKKKKEKGRKQGENSVYTQGRPDSVGRGWREKETR